MDKQEKSLEQRRTEALEHIKSILLYGIFPPLWLLVGVVFAK